MQGSNNEITADLDLASKFDACAKQKLTVAEPKSNNDALRVCLQQIYSATLKTCSAESVVWTMPIVGMDSPDPEVRRKIGQLNDGKLSNLLDRLERGVLVAMSRKVSDIAQDLSKPMAAKLLAAAKKNPSYAFTEIQLYCDSAEDSTLRRWLTFVIVLDNGKELSRVEHLFLRESQESLAYSP